MSVRLLKSGRSADLYEYVNEAGKSFVDEFISSCEVSQQKKIIKLLDTFIELGEIRNIEKFRCEENPVFVFKEFQARLYCFFLPDQTKKSIVLTHGTNKKRDKASSADLERAKRIYQEITKKKV